MSIIYTYKDILILFCLLVGLSIKSQVVAIILLLFRYHCCFCFWKQKAKLHLDTTVNTNSYEELKTKNVFFFESERHDFTFILYITTRLKLVLYFSHSFILINYGFALWHFSESKYQKESSQSSNQREP